MRQLKIVSQITLREGDSLQRYLKEIVKYPLISAEREVALAKKIQEGDSDALDELIKANLRFVVSVAKQNQNQGLSLSDLINEGNIGLGKAAQRFDHTRGFKFISYAVWWIRQSIMQAIAENARIVRLPMNKIGSTNKINKMIMKFEQRYERAPSHEELAELLEIPIGDIQDMHQGDTRYLSFDAPIAEGEEMTRIDYFQSAPVTGNVEDLLINESLKQDIGDILRNMISQRDADIVSHRFGINGKEELSLEAIGEKFSLTRERVRQIVDKTIRRFRKNPRVKKLNVYLGK